MKFLFVAPAIAFVLTTAHSAEPVSIGPFRTGMTLDELRAAAPQSEWTENSSKMDSKKEKVFRATAVTNIDGRPYDARITSGWYGEYEIVLFRRAQEKDGRSCLKIFESLTAEVEDRFGPFQATNKDYEDQSALETLGGKTRTETRKAGKASSYTWHETNAYVESSSRIPLASGELRTIGQYFVDSPLFGTSMCVTSFTIELKGAPPEFEEIDAKALKTVRTTSLGTLHNSLEGVTLPPDGVTVKARCRVARNNGGIGTCKYDPEPAGDIRNIVYWRNEEVQFDTANLSPGNPVPLFAQLEFRVDAKDRLELGTPVAPIKADDVEWRKASEAFVMDSIRSSAGALRERKYDTATAAADCQIQADGSLACLPAAITYDAGVIQDSYNIARFERAVKNNLWDRRAAESTRAGQSARGKWVHFLLPLKLDHDSQEEFDKRMAEMRKRIEEERATRKKKQEAP
jgi:hypothetical protein